MVNNTDILAYRLDLLRRINALVIEGAPLSHAKILDRYNVWQCFQSRLFYQDLRVFCDGAWPPPSPSLRMRVQASAALLTARIITCGGRLMLWLRRPKVLIYSVDRTNSKLSLSDARIDPVYRAVQKAGQRYIEAFYSLPGRDLVKNFLKRKRFALYGAAMGISFSHRPPALDWSRIDLSTFSESERPFVRATVEKYLAAIPLFIKRVERYKRLFEGSSLRLVLAIDDTRSYWEVVLAAHLAHIPAYAVQHGRFGKYHVGWLSDGTFDGEIIQPDRLYVWSEYWRHELLQLGTYFSPETICVGGSKDALPTLVPRDRREGLTVVLPYESEAVKEEVKPYIDALLECPDVRLLFSIRSDIDRSRQLKEYGLTEQYHPRFFITDDPARIAAEADMIVGTCSTFLYDLIGAERPVALLHTSSDLGEGLLRNNLADELTLDDPTLCETVRKIAETSHSVLSARKEKLFGDDQLRMEDTLRRLL